jgi:ATP-dependent Clp protease protease subunit
MMSKPATLARPRAIAVADDELLARLPEPAADAKHACRFEAKDGGQDAALHIYDQLYPWDAKYVLAALREVKAKTLNVNISSPGGDVFAGVAIYNALVRHSARVIVNVDGVAASIASVIAMAGDEIRMGEGAHMMIHDPHVFTAGTASELRETAKVLDKIAGSLAGIYAERTGKTEREVLELMAKTTWLTADEAIDEGFADAKSKRPAVQNRFDFSGFAGVPDELAAQAAEATERSRIETVRDFEALLREAGGFSREQAKAIAARGFRAKSEPREEADESQQDDAAAAVVVAGLRAALSRARLSHSTLTR